LKIGKIEMNKEQMIIEALRTVYDPELKKNIIELEMIRDIVVIEDKVSLTLALTTLRCPLKEKIVEDIKVVVKKIPGISAVKVNITAMSKEELDRLFPKHPLLGIEKVKHFIAVASGKGGVGKTTVAINLAMALSVEGFHVGLLDADIHGPSIPVMTGISERPDVEHNMIVPIGKFGLKIMSIGFMLDKNQPVIWRGPLISNAIREFLEKVMWGKLDFLIVDLPPGTGDTSITIAQSIPGASVVIVTTPQEVAIADVRKAIVMFQKMDAKVLGIVENMSYFQCAHSDERLEIFGRGGGERLSSEMGVPLLGSIPIDIELRKSGDEGVPLLERAPDTETSKIFRDIAKSIAASFHMIAEKK
jgi:ATP-binding protein involved in chromosome partitioning